MEVWRGEMGAVREEPTCAGGGLKKVGPSGGGRQWVLHGTEDGKKPGLRPGEMSFLTLKG